MDNTMIFALVVMGITFACCVVQLLSDMFEEIELRSRSGILEWKYRSSSDYAWEHVMTLPELNGTEKGTSHVKKLPVDVVPVKCCTKDELESFKKKLGNHYKFQKYMAELQKEKKRRKDFNDKVIY